MCLFKCNDRNSACNHDECKSAYAAQNQGCSTMFQPVQSHQFFGFQDPSLNAIQSQLLLSQNPAISLQPSLNLKRPASLLVNSGVEEQEAVFLNKKKVKLDSDPSGDNSSKNQSLNRQSAAQGDFNLQAQSMITPQMFDNRNSNAQIHFLQGNSVNGQTAPIKHENSNYFLNNSTYLIPVVQSQSQPVQINTAFPFFQPNQQKEYNVAPQKIDSYTSPNVRIDPMYMNTTNKPATESNTISQTLENYFKTFQANTAEFLLSQNKLLVELQEKNDTIQDTLACLINELSSLKDSIKTTSLKEPENVNKPVGMNPMTSNSLEIATTDILTNMLYGPTTDFSYQLLLKTNLELPLYRERNFKFTLVLTDMNGKIVENSNKIPLSLALYTSERTPKFIDSNTAGNKILKGFIEKDLVNGTVTFDKIQIKEVTSHFRNGWIFFIAYPKTLTSTNNTVMPSGKDIFVGSQKIRPFILEKVIVKAKKIKEKEEIQGNSVNVNEMINDVNDDSAIFYDEANESPQNND